MKPSKLLNLARKHVGLAALLSVVGLGACTPQDYAPVGDEDGPRITLSAESPHAAFNVKMCSDGRPVNAVELSIAYAEPIPLQLTMSGTTEGIQSFDLLGETPYGTFDENDDPCDDGFDVEFERLDEDLEGELTFDWSINASGWSGDTVTFTVTPQS